MVNERRRKEQERARENRQICREGRTGLMVKRLVMKIFENINMNK